MKKLLIIAASVTLPEDQFAAASLQSAVMAHAQDFRDRLNELKVEPAPEFEVKHSAVRGPKVAKPPAPPTPSTELEPEPQPSAEPQKADSPPWAGQPR